MEAHGNDAHGNNQRDTASMTRTLSSPFLLAAGLFLLALGGATTLAVTPAGAQAVVAMVNGEPITNTDIEQRMKLGALQGKRFADRKAALEEIINDKVKIKEAKKFGLSLTSSDIDSAFANMGQRMRMSADQLAKSLEGNGIRPEALKSKVHAELVWQQLVRGRFQQSLLVGEKDVLSAIQAKGGDSKSGDNFQYTLRTVVMVVPRGSGAGLADARRREAEALRGRIQSCDQAVSVFSAMKDAAIRAPVVKTSGDLPAALRATLDKTPIGQLTAPEASSRGIEMVALCDRKTTNADTPQERETREKLFAERFEAKSAQYLKEIRRNSLVEYR
jgi:peptidyl-prolyl cis-trans isomerase SurA